MGPISAKSQELGVVFQHMTEFIKKKWAIFKSALLVINVTEYLLYTSTETK